MVAARELGVNVRIRLASSEMGSEMGSSAELGGTECKFADTHKIPTAVGVTLSEPRLHAAALMRQWLFFVRCARSSSCECAILQGSTSDPGGRAVVLGVVI